MATPYKDVVVIGASRHGKTALADAMSAHAGWSKATAFKVHDGMPDGPIGGGAVLVIDATEGASGETHDAIRRAREAGAAWIVGYLTKVDAIADDDVELLDLYEMECRAMFGKHRYPDDDATILRGVAIDPSRARLDELLAACTRAAKR